jgi:hypothetical protein
MCRLDSLPIDIPLVSAVDFSLDGFRFCVHASATVATGNDRRRTVISSVVFSFVAIGFNVVSSLQGSCIIGVEVLAAGECGPKLFESLVGNDGLASFPLWDGSGTVEGACAKLLTNGWLENVSPLVRSSSSTANSPAERLCTIVPS